MLSHGDGGDGGGEHGEAHGGGEHGEAHGGGEHGDGVPFFLVLLLVLELDVQQRHHTCHVVLPARK